MLFSEYLCFLYRVSALNPLKVVLPRKYMTLALFIYMLVDNSLKEWSLIFCHPMRDLPAVELRNIFNIEFIFNQL